jgi:hypothetical protein
MQETVVTAMAPMHPAVAGELVSIDFDVCDGVTLPVRVALALKLEREPFIIGGGQILVEDAANHVVVGRIDPSEVDSGHCDAPEIIEAMIETGEEAILNEVGGADLGGLFSASELASPGVSAWELVVRVSFANAVADVPAKGAA